MARQSASPRPKHRLVPLRAIQRRKMAASAHAYVRGATRQFYAWLADSAAKLPQGPSIWICGDAHVGNLGPIADQVGHVAVQVRDLDHTVIGNPAHDLVRLALSLASLARGSDLPGPTTAEMLEALLNGYRRGLLRPSIEDDAAANRPRAVQSLLERSLRRRWKHLARERLDDPTPDIPLGKRFWRISAKERAALTALVETPDVQRLVTAVSHRDDDVRVRLLDAAYWVKGCSSLGRLRFALVVGVENDDGSAGYCLLDIKEAIAPDAPHASTDMPGVHAARVVAGAQALAPHLGERMRALRLLHRSVFIRELTPQDIKPDISRMTRAEAVRITEYFAGVLGRAHGRQLREDDRKAWSRALMRYRRARGQAPAWLWNATVELLGLHETGYLQHCRALLLDQA